MEKSILITGKDLPDGADFADGAEIKMRRIAITAQKGSKPAVAANISAVEWLRTSPVSARTLVLDSETAFGRIDEAVLYFDESYYTAKFSQLTPQACTESVDEMILGYQYLTLEILSRFEKRFAMNAGLEENQKPAKLVFLLRKSAGEYDVAKNPALRSLVPMASGPFVAAAAAAFQAFAENIAAIYGQRDYVTVILAQGDAGNGTAKFDKTLAEWICSYMDEVDGQKNRPSLKQSISWVKAGTKGPGFSLFR